MKAMAVVMEVKIISWRDCKSLRCDEGFNGWEAIAYQHYGEVQCMRRVTSGVPFRKMIKSCQLKYQSRPASQANLEI